MIIPTYNIPENVSKTKCLSTRIIGSLNKIDAIGYVRTVIEYYTEVKRILFYIIHNIHVVDVTTIIPILRLDSAKRKQEAVRYTIQRVGVVIIESSSRSVRPQNDIAI